MTNYDDLFDETAPDDSVFVNKAALDPLREPDEIMAREDKEKELATILNGVHDGYLPTTMSIHGPPGTGKTLITRRLCREFAARHDQVAVQYVNLKECRTLFSAANEILLELTGERKGAHKGLDGVFEGIWTALEEYPEWTVLILDEIDHVRHDSNYSPSEFFYRLLRGEGKLSRGLQLSVWLVSNQLLEVDLRLDSRVESAMSGEKVSFPPYGAKELLELVNPRLDRAFRDGAMPSAVREFGADEAARRWGDARKTLTLFRQAGETATEQGLTEVTEACVEANLETTERDAVTEQLLSLPFNHFFVLVGATIRNDPETGKKKQPVTTTEISEFTQNERVSSKLKLGDRTVRNLVGDLETMGLVDTWIESRGRNGRVKQVVTPFDPEWVVEAIPQFLEKNDK